MKLDITRKTDLAVRALLVLDASGQRMKSSEVADLICSTNGFVPQVLAPLVQARWVRSDPGPSGGYVLIDDLDRISMLDVIEAVEGPADLDVCVLDGGHCDDVGHCAIHDAWVRARGQLLDELRSTSLRDIQRNPPRDFPCP